MLKKVNRFCRQKKHSIKIKKIMETENESQNASTETLSGDQWQRRDYYQRFYRHVDETNNSARDGEKEDLEPLIISMRAFLEKEELIDLMYSTAMTSRKYPDNVLTHSVNCTIYSIMIGRGLGYSLEKLEELALSVLVHDVGMAFLPEELLEKTGGLTQKEFMKIRKHPGYGYKYLKESYPEMPYLALTAYHEHEREDGSGYNQGLTGNDIFKYAKICGAVDIFEALTHDRPNRNKMLPFEAIQSILQKDKKKFSRPILKALIKCLSLFPKYSFVKLNTNAIAQVIDVDEKFPLRPTLKILLDSKGEKIIEEQIVDLKQNFLLYITGSAEALAVDE